jgi:hypothetical protein
MVAACSTGSIFRESLVLYFVCVLLFVFLSVLVPGVPRERRGAYVRSAMLAGGTSAI